MFLYLQPPFKQRRVKQWEKPLTTIYPWVTVRLRIDDTTAFPALLRTWVDVDLEAPDFWLLWVGGTA